MPRVSIIAGAYNIGSYHSLEESMSSILEQSFSDFEFIICDDGSQDNTYALLSEYAERDPRIRILKNEKNAGLAASLNKCLAVAGGEYVARHDLDDYCARDRLEKQIKFLDENTNVSVLGTDAYLFDEEGVWGKRSFPAKVTRRDFLFTSPYQHGSVVFRKEALLKAGGYRVAKETYRAEDYDLFMTMATFSEGANLSEPLYYFCEDKSTLKRRKYKYRIGEAKVRFRGFRKLGLMPKGIFYVIKPLVVGLLPAGLLHKLRLRRKKGTTLVSKEN